IATYLGDAYRNNARSDFIADRLRELGVLTQEELEAVKAEKTSTDMARTLIDRARKKGDAPLIKFARFRSVNIFSKKKPHSGRITTRRYVHLFIAYSIPR
uniref:CARD domain-containing protein n=1 Tax=Monopterus albus TaxID=43700 RepID=A0A3Q3JT85_MONAL